MLAVATEGEIMPEPPPQAFRVDRDLCVGSGVCAVYAPRTFDVGDDGKVVVDRGAHEEAAHVLLAVEGCPTGALSLPDTP